MLKRKLIEGIFNYSKMSPRRGRTTGGKSFTVFAICIQRQKLSRKALLFALFLCKVLSLTKTSATDEANYEPPFPLMIRWNQKQIKIVSEVIDEHDVGLRTQEEYVDFAAGKAAFVTTNKAGHSVRYLDANEGLSFTYRPYKCRVERIQDLSYDLRIKDPDNLLGGSDNELIWNYNIPAKIVTGRHETSDISVSNQSMPNWESEVNPKRTLELRLFGVSSLWLLASEMQRSFQRAQIIYSAASNIYRDSLLWSVEDEPRKIRVKLFFMEKWRSNDNSTASNTGLFPKVKDNFKDFPTLEMIRIESTEDGRMIQTINVLSIDNSIASEAQDDILNVPLGYGCFSSLTDDWAGNQWELASEVRLRRAFASRYETPVAWQGHAELEVTATRFLENTWEDKEKGNVESPRSDTFTIEMAQSRTGILSDISSGDRIKLVRWRNSIEDNKVIINYNTRVKYSINMITGTCEMSNIESMKIGMQESSKSDKISYSQEQIYFRFRNGAGFDANVELFSEENMNLHFIKSTGFASKKREQHYYEGTIGSSQALINWFSNSTSFSKEDIKRTRVIRAYSVSRPEDNAGTNSAEPNPIELLSMTVWLLDEEEANIRQSYQIYVIDSRPQSEPINWVEQAKIFDFSHECYLENALMVQNRDFAWTELTYPAPSRLLSLVSERLNELKQTYYHRFIGDFTRVPRVEVFIEEDKFILRTLIIDLPPINIVYAWSIGVKFKPNLDLGDHDYLTPSMHQCARLCESSHCTVMGYCSETKVCTLSQRQLHSFVSSGQKQSNGEIGTHLDITTKYDQFDLSPDYHCDTYKIPHYLEMHNFYKTGKLTSIIAMLKNQNYEPQASMPQTPDEVSLPQAESGLSDEDRQKAIEDYLAEVRNFLASGNRLPQLAFSLELGGHFFFLLPTKFELDRDPLEEFDLRNSTEFEEAGDSLLSANNDQPAQPHFHEGLSMSRFNLGKVHALQAASKEGNSDDEQATLAASLSFRIYSGLNYDQCASACWDSKCGTFSYCQHDRECVLSNVNTSSRIRALDLQAHDSDCFIAQRDFLGNFIKFSNVFRPQIYRLVSEQTATTDPSECALNCVAEKRFHCLAFQFCASSGSNEVAARGGRCYYQKSHHTGNEVASGNTGCDHYARSYLADFLRVDSHRVNKTILEQLSTNNFKQVSVFECAEKCATELADCSAFQFCHYAPTADYAQAVRECITIESKITTSMLKDFDLTKSANASQTVVDERVEGAVSKAGNYLVGDIDCQLFTLRKDSSEAHLRDLAFGDLIRTTDEQVNNRDKEDPSGLTFIGGFLLYLTVTSVTAIVAMAIMLLRDNQDHVRQKIERLRIVTGI